MDDETDAPLAPIIDIKLRRERYCGHKGSQCTINEYQRTVECNCGALLDPFDVLLRIAREWENRQAAWRQLLRDTEAASARLADLKRDEANVRARLARLRKHKDDLGPQPLDVP